MPPREAPLRTAPLRRALRILAAGLLVLYLAWNLFWIAQLRVPPSLWTATTGLPCPTTGGTRSVRCLLAGEWVESWRYNAMTIPIVAMLATTLVLGIVRYGRHGRVALPSWTLWAWLALLAVAWVLKLLGPREYW